MNKATLNLEEHRCTKCGRVFYIDAVDRRPLNLDLGCPHGCDGGSERMRGVIAESRLRLGGGTYDRHI